MTRNQPSSWGGIAGAPSLDLGRRGWPCSGALKAGGAVRSHHCSEEVGQQDTGGYQCCVDISVMFGSITSLTASMSADYRRCASPCSGGLPAWTASAWLCCRRRSAASVTRAQAAAESGAAA